jgi:hypothetical protein
MSGKSLSDKQKDLEQLGLARRVRRKLRDYLIAEGVSSRGLPEILQDKVIFRSRTGKLGAIVVREFSGVDKNPASRLVKRFENTITGGKEDIIEHIEAVVDRPKSMDALVALMKEKPQISFARAIAESKADPAVALDTYAKGVMALKKTEVLLGLYKEMPSIFRDLMRHAIDKETTCDLCLGTRLVQEQAGRNKLNMECPRCGGSGKLVTTSEHKEFAIQKALEMSEMLPKKGPLVAVQNNQQINNNVVDGGGLLERMSRAADAILYNRDKEQAAVIDAEVTDGTTDERI